MPCWVILFWKFFFVSQYFWKPPGSSKLNFFSSEKTTFRHSLALMVWNLRAYSSRFYLCFKVNLGRWIIFLCLIFSLFKYLRIVLVLQEISIFLVLTIFSFFTSQTVLLLNCGDNFSSLPVIFLVPYLQWVAKVFSTLVFLVFLKKISSQF